MRALLKLTQIETRLFLREPMAVIFAFAFPFFVLFVLAGVFGNEIDPNDPEDIEDWGGVDPVEYYVPAYVGLVMASVGLITLPLRLAGYRERGVLKRFRAAGLPLVAIFGSQVIVFFVSSIVGGLAIALSGKLVYGVSFPELPARCAAAFVLSGMAFAAIGVFLGAVLRTARTAQSAGLLLFFVMMFICGAGPPRGVLSDGMIAAGNLLPLTHVILLLQDAWLGRGWDMSAAIVVTGFMLVCAALAERFFRWE